MNLPPCNMEDRDGQMWCLDCQRFHLGHTVAIAMDAGEKGQKYRAIWRSLSKHLRSLPLAKQCRYFGPALTLEEVKAKQLAGCRSCDGKIHVHHCTFPGKKAFLDGPYTRGAECMRCTDWEKKPDDFHKSPPPGSEPFPEKQPATLKALLTVGDRTREFTLPGIVTEQLAIWDHRETRQEGGWLNVSLMHQDGPVKHYRFSMERYAEGKRQFHIYSARLKLLSAAPFYAVAGGIFVADEKTATADAVELVGVKWAVSIAEVKP